MAMAGRAHAAGIVSVAGAGVSEPVKPVMPCVVMSNTVHAYISQSDKGELVIGAGTDAYTSYSQAGGPHIAMHTLEAICELFPSFRRLRMLRNWGGIVDTHAGPLADHRADAGAGAVRQLRLGHGRVQGDARARAMCSRRRSPGGEPHPIAAPFGLDRFRTGRLIDEAAAAAVSH